MSLPTELHDLLPLPPRERHYNWTLIDRGIQYVLGLLDKKHRCEAVIENHKAKLKYHQDKLKEAELRISIYESQIAFSKEKLKKEIEEVRDDLKEREE